MNPFFGSPWGRRGWVHRGDSRVLVLKVLKEEPMHGYEIMKRISEMTQGFYSPSPGMVYPTLAWLEETGYVKAAQKDGTKVYKITPAGTKFLGKKMEKIERLRRQVRESLGEERVEFFHKALGVGRTFIDLMHDMTPEEAKRASNILDDTVEKLKKVKGER